MTKIKIAFQGEKGAYSHLACEEIFKGADIQNCATFEETFKLAFDDENYKAIIPIENSLAGRVADIHYLLPKYKLQIYAEHFQKVEHCLLSKPEAKISDIKYVRSHAQAIGQCQEIIKKINLNPLSQQTLLVLQRNSQKTKTLRLQLLHLNLQLKFMD
jgi:prephenate dehydratase